MSPEANKPYHTIVNIPMHMQIQTPMRAAMPASMQAIMRMSVFGFAFVFVGCGVVCMVRLLKVSVGDIVFRADEAGRICSCVRQEGRLLALVKLLTFVSQLSEHAGSYRPSDLVQVWRIESLEQSLAWYSSADGLLTVVR